ncbi:MAG: hypothetical protein EOO01_37360 [Chitinophagaceae bacterium]|nr:MAG: hypothetical protein EOO01_37360 [Chitinophagaceae bacterium]
MKTILLCTLMLVCTILSCRDNTSNTATISENDTTGIAYAEVGREPEKQMEKWRDPYFPRFCISSEDYERLKRNYELGCTLEEGYCELQTASYLFDQLASIESVHRSVLEDAKGRYGTDGNDAKRYATLRGICNDGDEGKVSGYATILFSIKSQNPRTLNSVFYYDLASICPPPHLTCIPAVPGPTSGGNDTIQH